MHQIFFYLNSCHFLVPKALPWIPDDSPYTGYGIIFTIFNNNQKNHRSSTYVVPSHVSFI